MIVRSLELYENGKFTMATFHRGSWLVIAGKLDAMFLSSEFVLFPVYWPYYLQMHNLPCINCFEPAFWKLFNGHEKMFNSRDERGISVWLCNVFVVWFGENMRPVWVCASCAPPYLHQTGISHCLPRTSTTFKSLQATRVMHMTFNLHPLPCCVCVSVRLPMSWLWWALWPQLLSDVLPGLKTENQ